MPMRTRSRGGGRPQRSLLALLYWLCSGLLGQCRRHPMGLETGTSDASLWSGNHQAWSLHSDFACHDIKAYTWTRRVCFDPVAPLESECPEGKDCAGLYVIRMSVRKRKGGLAEPDGETLLSLAVTGAEEQDFKPLGASAESAHAGRPMTWTEVGEVRSHAGEAHDDDALVTWSLGRRRLAHVDDGASSGWEDSRNSHYSHGDWEPTCGDSFRARFTSPRDEIWFASTSRVLQEKPCDAKYSIVLRPPLQAAEYNMEVRLMHVDGEGMADPVNWTEAVLWYDPGYNGPTVYNLRFLARGTLQVKPISHSDSSQPANPLGLVRHHGHAEHGHTPDPSTRHPVLPQCTSGDHPGRWTLADDLRYPPFEGEPLHWLPYDCRYRMYTTAALRTCLQRKSKMSVWMLGESILHDLYALIQTHLNGTKERVNDLWANYYWPQYHEGWAEYDDRPFHRQIHLQMLHGLGYLLPVLRKLAKDWHHDPATAPTVLVMLTAHNDMMRFSRDTYESNMRELVSILKDQGYQGRIVWIIAPVRVYKLAGTPGECRCPGGKSHECGLKNEQKHCWCACSEVNTFVRERVVKTPDVATEGDWFQENTLPWPEFPDRLAIRQHCAHSHPVDPGIVSFEAELLQPMESIPRQYESRTLPVMHNTYERVKWANAKAVEILRSAFPDTQLSFVDYEAITEPLTPDYVEDGVHWGCSPLWRAQRQACPWQCRNLASATTANVLLNLICEME